MFARHTHTRMRSSGVVQGLKSLASKLHPQLPLTARESNSLLNTLTSSFRKHLDEAHPIAAEEETKSVAKGVKEEARAALRIHHGQSAAASADDHLTKLLTNPLLLRRDRENVLDYDTAKAELARTSSQDPMELLERYQDQGAASLPIATLCLDTVWAYLLSRPIEERKQYIKSTEPGRRALRWFLATNSYESERFWKSKTSVFTERTTKLLLLEGREETVWDWLSLDLPSLEANEELPATEQLTPDQAEERVARYTWRSQILDVMTSHKLASDEYTSWHYRGPTWPTTDCLHAGIDVWIRACELRLSVDRHHHLYWTPLRGLYAKIVGATRHRNRLRRDLDGEKYDKMCEYVECISLPGHPVSAIWPGIVAAEFQLWHPKGRRPLPAYQCLRPHGPTGSVLGAPQIVHEMLNKPRTKTAMFHTIARTIYELRRQGHTDKATDLDAATKHLFHDFESFSSYRMSQLERDDRRSGADADPRPGIKTFSFGRLGNPVPSLT